MTTTTVQNNEHTMKHIVFIILGAVIVMCLAVVPGSCDPKAKLRLWGCQAIQQTRLRSPSGK